MKSLNVRVASAPTTLLSDRPSASVPNGAGELLSAAAGAAAPVSAASGDPGMIVLAGFSGGLCAAAGGGAAVCAAAGGCATVCAAAGIPKARERSRTARGKERIGGAKGGNGG